ASALEPVRGEGREVVMHRASQSHFGARIGAAVRRAKNEGRVHMRRDAAQIRQIVIDEGLRIELLDRIGLRASLTGSVARRDDALDRKTEIAQVAQPRRLVLELERRDTDELEPGIVQTMASFDRTFDRRHRSPEGLVEMAEKVRAPRFVEAFDLPAI